MPRLRRCCLVVAIIAVFTVPNAGCGGGGGVPIPEGLEDAVAAAEDPTRNFQVQYSADSAAVIRQRLATVFPEIAEFVASGSDGRAYMLQFFTGTPSFNNDIKLLIYAEALRQMGDASVLSALKSFLSDNINGNLIWTPHYVTHTIKTLQGDTDLELSSYYTAQQMQAAAASSSSSTSLAAVNKASSDKPNCKRQYILVDQFNNPLTYVDSNGVTRQAVVHGNVWFNNDVPDKVRNNYIDAVEVKGGGTYVTDDPIYPGEPSKHFNCAGYAFRSFNGYQPWTSDPGDMFEVLNGANLLYEVSDSTAKPGDIVFYYAPGATTSTRPAHVAEVHQIQFGGSSMVTVRNADGQSGLFDADIDADYFTGNFFEAARYPTHRIFRWLDGAPPSVIPDVSVTGNGAYCGEGDSGGVSDGEFSVNISIPGFSVYFNPGLVIAANDTASSGEIVINNVPTISAFENATSMNFDMFTIYFDPRQISGPGDYILRTLDQVLVSQNGEACIVFTTQDVKNVDDGTPVVFVSTSGTVSLDEYGESDGDTLAGSFSGSIAGDRVTGTDGSGDPIRSTVTGSVDGSFNLTIK